MNGNMNIPKLYVDPKSKAWSRLEGDWVSVDLRQSVRSSVPNYNCQFITRDKLLAVNPPFYITQAHYDDHREDLLEYVRRGGGLIMGGHAWWWSGQLQEQGQQHCVLLDHPGNKIISEFGLALSNDTVDHRDSAFPIKTKEMPSIKVEGQTYDNSKPNLVHI